MKPPKFYAVARSSRKVTVKEVCKRITERSSYSKGELEGCIGEFLLEIVNVLNEGNIVQMGDLGNFRMSIKTDTPTDTAKEFKASCIDKDKVLFYPGSDLRKLCKTLDYTFFILIYMKKQLWKNILHFIVTIATSIISV